MRGLLQAYDRVTVCGTRFTAAADGAELKLDVVLTCEGGAFVTPRFGDETDTFGGVGLFAPSDPPTASEFPFELLVVVA